MDIYTVGGACAAVAYCLGCCGLMVLCSPLVFPLLDRMFWLLDKAFLLNRKS